MRSLTFAIKTQRKARNAPVGVFHPKAPSRGLWVPLTVSLWHKRAGVANFANFAFQAHLASVQSEAENAFINSLANPVTTATVQRFPIGGGKSLGSWVWNANQPPNISPRSFVCEKPITDGVAI